MEGKLAYKTPKTNLDKNDQEDASAKDFHTGNENSEDDDATELGGCIGRKRSDTLDLFNDEIFNEKRRHRSDTMDFLTAAIAGDMGQYSIDGIQEEGADDDEIARNLMMRRATVGTFHSVCSKVG